jgi:hypothetical protein
MAALPSQQLTVRAAALVLVFAAAGCTLDQAWTTKAGSASGLGKPCELAIAWLPHVQSAPDVVHEGVPTPGLVGRLYMFDQTEKYPVLGDGAVLITLFDDTKGPATQPLEQWYIDPVALKKFAKKDTVGWGYTLFLPWGSCRPDVTKVHLTCKYEPPGGSPIFAPVSPLALEHDTPAYGPAVVLPQPPAPRPPASLPPQLPMPTPVR